VVSSQRCADFNEVVRRHAKLYQFLFRSNGSLGKALAFRFGNTFHFCRARAELKCGVTVTLLRLVGHNLNIFQCQNCDRDMRAGVIKHAGHTQFFSYKAGPHD